MTSTERYWLAQQGHRGRVAARGIAVKNRAASQGGTGHLQQLTKLGNRKSAVRRHGLIVNNLLWHHPTCPAICALCALCLWSPSALGSVAAIVPHLLSCRFQILRTSGWCSTVTPPHLVDTEEQRPELWIGDSHGRQLRALANRQPELFVLEETLSGGTSALSTRTLLAAAGTTQWVQRCGRVPKHLCHSPQRVGPNPPRQ